MSRSRRAPAAHLLIGGAVFAPIGKFIAPYYGVLSLGMAIGLVAVLAIGTFTSR